MSIHSRERASERYNIELSEADERSLLGYINNGQCFKVNQESSKANTAICYVRFRKIPLKVVYLVDKNKKAVNIITTLPFNGEECNKVVQERWERDISNNIKFLKANGYIVYKKKEV